MNVLWDFRLFSYGYRDRGIGVWCRSVTSSILRLQPKINLFVWGDRAAVPAVLQDQSFTWIPYRKGSWKSCILILPWLVIHHRIDLLHYWVALGPLRAIGISPLCPCPSIACVFDMGVENWDIPHCRAVKRSTYWAMQKRFFTSTNGCLADSAATMGEITHVFSAVPEVRQVVYMPIHDEHMIPPSIERLPYFITLGGSIHKNCLRVVKAFSHVRSRHPDYRLVILGETDTIEESLINLPGGVMLEPSLERYEEHLRSCSGLLFCSLYEGLGIPPLEAMSFGCPLLLSDIPPLRETCSDAGLFVDPLSVEAITAGIEKLITDTSEWAMRSLTGAKVYHSLSNDSPDQVLRMYEQLTGTTMARKAADSSHPSRERL